MRGANPKITELVTFLTVASSALVFLFNFLAKVRELDNYAYSSETSLDSALIVIIIIALIVIVLYILSVVSLMFILLHYRGRPGAMSDKMKTVRKILLEFIYWGHVDLARSLSMPLLLLSGALLIPFLQSKLLLMFGLVLVIMLLAFLLAIQTLFNIHNRTYKGVMVFFFVLSIPILLYILVNTFLYLTTTIIIEYDDDFNDAADPLKVSVYPKGLLNDPEITLIEYSNQRILKEERNKTEFSSAPAYFVVMPSEFKSQPENSFVVVHYRYGMSFFFIPEPDASFKVKGVPVFYSRGAANEDFVMNNTNR